MKKSLKTFIIGISLIVPITVQSSNQTGENTECSIDQLQLCNDQIDSPQHLKKLIH